MHMHIFTELYILHSYSEIVEVYFDIFLQAQTQMKQM